MLGESGPKIPKIPWQGTHTEREVEELNKSALRQRGMGKQQEQPAVINNLSPEDIAVARQKAEEIVADATHAEQIEATQQMDTLIATMPQPAMLLAPLHAINPVIERTTDQRIRDLAVALAFLYLTD